MSDLFQESSLSANKRINNADLSFREKEVLALSASGNSCKEIAETLFVSVETVKSHRKNIIRKLGISGKIEFRKFLIDFRTLN